jgi:hypothetical protein
LIHSSDNGFVACGFSTSYGDSSIYIVKTDVDGNLLWQRHFICLENGAARDVLEVNSYYYVIGNSYDADYNSWIYLTKLSYDGTQQWSKTYQYPTGGTSLVLSPENTLIVNGRSKIIEMNLDGEIIWTKDVEPSFEIDDIDVTPDGGYILSGSKCYSNQYLHAAMIKTDSLGIATWMKVYPGISTDYWGSFVSVKNTGFSGYVACGYSNYANYNTLLHIARTDPDGDFLTGFSPAESFNSSLFYPNPTHGKIHTDLQDIKQVEVLTAAGLLVKSLFFPTELDISDLPSSIYVLKIHSSGKITYEKVLKL